MEIGDARSLSAGAQEALRRRAVAAVLKGDKQRVVADRFGVTPQAVSRWVTRYRKGGQRALAAKRQGRPPGGGRLQGFQAAWVKRMVVSKHPDQLRLPGFLWTRTLVRQLIIDKWDIELAVETVGRYLKRWGLTVQKPSRRAFEQSEPAVKAWLDEHYPQIKAEAAAEGAQILWGDEAGAQTEHQTGTTWGLKGKTPPVRRSAKRLKVNIISAVSNEGSLRFMVFDGRFTQQTFMDFMRRLIRGAKGRIYLILDNHVVHRGKLVRKWLVEHDDQIRVILLPSYSPELNPDEVLNNDLKQNIGRSRITTQKQLERDVRSHLRKRQYQPDIVKGYFTTPTTAYAA